jgi:hypothetical protein
MTRLGFQTRLPFDNASAQRWCPPTGGFAPRRGNRLGLSNRKAALDHRLASVLWVLARAPEAGHDGRVAEWFKAPVLKTGRGFTLPRGFESHPFRHCMFRTNLPRGPAGITDRILSSWGRLKQKPLPRMLLLLSYTPMSAPALSKFDRIPVRVMNPHQSLPRLLVGRLEKLNPTTF